jgi:carboxyl-terminal processing protease
VALLLLHKDDQKPVTIQITRDTISVKSVTSWTKPVKEIEGINTKAPELSQLQDSKVVYIRLSQFGDTTHDEWQKIAAIVSQEMKTDNTIKGVVFDLRNNPGGYLNDAVYIASEFIKDGNAVMQEDKDKVRTNYPVSGKGVLTDVPVVVLINKGSASASEIVAGALRDHTRASLVGDTSFGKGTIQEAEDLGDGAGLHVTIAKWLTPNGTWVHMKGIEPDVKVQTDTKDESHDAQLEKAVITLLQK